MSKYALIAVLATVVGCSQYRTLVGEEGRKASDSALHDAMWVVCDVATVGSVRRKFDTPQERSEYESFCARRK